MNIRFCLIIVACFMFSCAPLFAQDGSSVKAVDMEHSVDAVTISAPVIEQLDSIIRATGGVLFRQSTIRMTASEASYDAANRTGKLKNIMFTTCESTHPDYRFEASELTLLGKDRVRMRGASLYLGQFRVLALPTLVFRVGGRGVGRKLFPIPSYDKDDGFGLSQEFRLADTDRFRALADIAFKTKRGLEGQIEYEYGLDGKLAPIPGRFLPYEAQQSSVPVMPMVPITEPLGRTYPERRDNETKARIRQFGRFSLKQRTYDIRNTGLLVFRQPELGLIYIAPHVDLARAGLDPRLQLYPQIAATWGRYKETPGQEVFTSRSGVNLAMTANLFPLGRSAAIQPMVMYGISNYGNGSSYRTWGYGVDASRLFHSGAIVTARYIKRNDSGKSPFLFDTVDVFREFQGAFQVPIGKHILGFVAGLNVDTGKVYDWEALYGYRTDCLAAWITWHSRLQRLSFDVAIINL